MLNIVIPAAGSGQRFADAGYRQPKPLIDVAGKSMIVRVIESLTPADNDCVFTVITRVDPFFIASGLVQQRSYKPWVDIHHLTHETRGAVDTLLAVKNEIDGPVLVANCDQYLAPGVIDSFLETMHEHEAGIIVFNSTNPHHSYARIDDYDRVTEVVEKRVITDDALAGVYYFDEASTLFRLAQEVIDSDEKVNGEFYVSSILSTFIAEGGELSSYEVNVRDKHMLGTPEELTIFLDKVRDGRVVL